MDDKALREAAALARRGKATVELGAMRALPLDFLSDASARVSIEADLAELDVALAQRISKCAVLLAGQLIVAILIDVIDQHGAALRADISDTRPSDGASFDLLIAIAVHHALVSESLGRALVEARTRYELANLSDVARRSSLHHDKKWDEASAAASILRKLARSLEDAHRDGRIRTYVDLGSR